MATETDKQVPSPVATETDKQVPSPVATETDKQVPKPVATETDKQVGTKACLCGLINRYAHLWLRRLINTYPNLSMETDK